MPRTGWLAIVVLLLVTASPGVEALDDAGSSQTSVEGQTIQLTQELHLTPDRAGEIDVIQSFAIPSSVTRLRTRIPAKATLLEARGFSHDSGSTYVWSGDGPTPSLTYRVPANETIDAGGPIASHGKYRFVDAGEWALVRRPQTAVSWEWRGEDDVTVARSLSIAGQGVAGEEMAYLGAHRVVTHTAAGQRFELVVPARAELGEPPAEIFDVVSHASRELQVGDRDEEVFMVAAPTTGVDWGVRGMQTGAADLWVRDAEQITTAENVWVHEYVHTRQNFSTVEATRWVSEAVATYYAALFTLEQGMIEYDTFRTRLAAGTADPQARAILTEPDTWSNTAQYDKGALVIGAIDRQIRLATDRRDTFQHVFASMNTESDVVTSEVFLDMVQEVAGPSVRADTEQFTTTRAAPELWSEAEHTRVFESDSTQISHVLVSDSFEVSGPYRNRSLENLILVPGERLSLEARVTNTGGSADTYDVALRVDSEPVARSSGILDAGATTHVEFGHPFELVGNYILAIGAHTTEVRVDGPATARVADLSVDRQSVETGQRINVTATIHNSAMIPGEALVRFRTDDRTIATRTVRLDAETSHTVSIPVSFESGGMHQITAGTATVTVEVYPAGKTETSSETDRVLTARETPTDGQPLDGFGGIPALLAIGLVLLLARRK